MKAIDSKILAIKRKPETSIKKLQESLGSIKICTDSMFDWDYSEVISVGKKVEEVKPGDFILTYKNSGHEFSYDDGSDKEVDGKSEKYTLYTTTDVIVVL